MDRLVKEKLDHVLASSGRLSRFWRSLCAAACCAWKFRRLSPSEKKGLVD